LRRTRVDCGLPRRLDLPNQKCRYAATCRRILGFFSCEMEPVINHVSNTTSKLDCTAEQVAGTNWIDSIYRHNLRHKKLLLLKNVIFHPCTDEKTQCSAANIRVVRGDGRDAVWSRVCLDATCGRFSGRLSPVYQVTTSLLHLTPLWRWSSLVLPPGG
jgi:hypothetical protein